MELTEKFYNEDMIERLTLQMKLGTTWHDAGELVIDARRPWVQFTYDVAHVFPDDEALAGLSERFRAVSLRLPLDLMPRSHDHWPALLDDIAPGGAARRWWLTHLGLGRRSEAEQRLELLRRATIAPIGNLRIKESVAELPRDVEPMRFPLQSVLEREYEFLEHARRQGASVGGATGAGGDAPKMLLRVGEDERVWIDTLQEDDGPDAHYLVKFPRRTLPTHGGSAPHESERDRTILVSEHAYYRALHELGVDTVDVTRMQLRHDSHGRPSLWLPRFDIEQRDGAMLRLGMESFYALTDTPAGKQCEHRFYLDALHRVLVEESFLDAPEPRRRRRPRRSPQATALVVEIIWRDLLNVVFGNCDNHGRNSAVLKTPEGVRLAPVYDFAPMAMDLDAVARSTRWPRELEGHTFDWRGICEAQAHLAEPEEVWSRLRERAARLRDLDARLEALGLPEETLSFPSIGLRHVNDKLRAWDLWP